MASTTGKNRSILAGLVSGESVTDTPTAQRERASPERLTPRMTALARVTAGDVQEKTFRLVDPARCRMWEWHNRRYDMLDEFSCADLLESLRAQGEQEFPAVVRRVQNSSEFDYEVICGARRHWSVSYLRSVEHRDIQFLVEARDLTDEAAFRLADSENRARKDISDYERALDYRRAVETYYGGMAVRMAERLEVSKGWLSRFLDLAKLPADIVSAFGDVRQLRENHARELKPLIAEPTTRSRVMAEAKRLSNLQAAARQGGEALLDAPRVMAALKVAATGGPQTVAAKSARPATVTNAQGAVLFTWERKGTTKLVLTIDLGVNAANEDFREAFGRELDRIRPAT